MHFQFNKLVLKDWIAYGGKQEISFPEYKDGKNLIVINGKNGFGKTSILRAFEFLFHNPYSHGEFFDLWHEKSQERETGSLYVSLEFNYKGTPYKLTRSVEFKENGDIISPYHNLELLNLSLGELEDQVEDKIELMVPRKSQQFSFFDGAEIVRYSKKQHEEGVKEAIEQMLGIPVLRNLRYDLRKLLEELEQEQAEHLAKEEKGQDLADAIEELRQKNDNLEIRLEDLKEKRESIKDALSELEKEAVKVSEYESFKEQKKVKEERLKEVEESLNEVDDKIKKMLSNAPLYLLESKLTKIHEEVMAFQNINPRSQQLKNQKNFLEDLLDEVECVCGRKFEDKYIEHIENKIKTLEQQITQPQKKETQFSVFDMNQISTRINFLKEMKDDSQELFAKRSDLEQKIQEIKSDIKDLRNKLEGKADIKLEELLSQQNNLQEKKREIQVKIDGNIQSLEEVVRAIRDKQRELDQTTSETSGGGKLIKTIQKTRNTLEAVEDLIEQMVTEKKNDIEEIASQIFIDITNKPIEYKSIKVNEDYTLEVCRQDGSFIENDKLSAGEKEVLAYSFITALNLASPNPSPFVMDTPFGHLDSDHRDGLLRSLPELKVQAILLATNRDLPQEEKSIVDPYLAEEFEINRDQRNASSTIEKV